MTDVEEQSMTVLNCCNEHELERLTTKLRRLKTKYPNHTIKNLKVI